VVGVIETTGVTEYDKEAVLMATLVKTAGVDGDQFALPRGFAGRIAGRLMGVANADMERAAIRNLELEGSERVLEIGFGPGVGIRYLVRRLPWGYVAGVDPSEVMLKQATKRIRRFMRLGSIDLRLGDASHLPWPDGRFDAALSVNNVMLWDPLDACMAELRRVVKADGRVSLAVHGWANKPTTGECRDLHAEVTEALWLNGFTAVTCRAARSMSRRALYFKARAH
jgi:ubiquinone/menaquinone biosynthesis C-methylase UbiE